MCMCVFRRYALHFLPILNLKYIYTKKVADAQQDTDTAEKVCCFFFLIQKRAGNKKR